MESFKTKWNNDFDQTNDIYKLRNVNKSELDELKIIKRASIFVILKVYEIYFLLVQFLILTLNQVRREALKRLYRDDLQSYEEELKQRGLCIHKERL
jgi:hypothetical protein